ncbi:hypothetical protein BJ875DRAFT_466617 [Amylocarpus encephaloides]|uniref:Uncharacterized protein n=1 Tax=Amylocarpus encephaloides TaxID=45428 RepID=A0A9P7YFF5_9HELO|nr:hypothetical protein BJ875DRAFT_466617 [Amylocarpus encephaloides]
MAFSAQEICLQVPFQVSSLQECSLVSANSQMEWFFLIQGAATVFVDIIAFLLLPNPPLETSWLTPEERKLTNDRIERHTIGRRQDGTTVWKGLRETVLDPYPGRLASSTSGHGTSPSLKSSCLYQLCYRPWWS